MTIVIARHVVQPQGSPEKNVDVAVLIEESDSRGTGEVTDVKSSIVFGVIDERGTEKRVLFLGIFLSIHSRKQLLQHQYITYH